MDIKITLSKVEPRTGSNAILHSKYQDHPPNSAGLVGLPSSSRGGSLMIGDSGGCTSSLASYGRTSFASSSCFGAEISSPWSSEGPGPSSPAPPAAVSRLRLRLTSTQTTKQTVTPSIASPPMTPPTMAPVASFLVLVPSLLLSVLLVAGTSTAVEVGVGVGVGVKVGDGREDLDVSELAVVLLVFEVSEEVVTVTEDGDFPSNFVDRCSVTVSSHWMSRLRHPSIRFHPSSPSSLIKV